MIKANKFITLSLVFHFYSVIIKLVDYDRHFFPVTSGDTGSSSLQAISAVDCADAIVAFPKGIISPIQELQMITVTSDNCHVLRGESHS